ncbi:unnamed protein product [marine sediment metagenome]|uniref:Uncharacterized protein n=1 Tax=marine sediment metagenome TaxID=412755 RepID=X0YL04_9ZZZZ
MPKPRIVLAIFFLLFVLVRSEEKKPAAIIIVDNLVIDGKATSWPRKVEPISAPRVTARLC